MYQPLSLASLAQGVLARKKAAIDAQKIEASMRLARIHGLVNSRTLSYLIRYIMMIGLKDEYDGIVHVIMHLKDEGFPMNQSEELIEATVRFLRIHFSNRPG